MHELAVTEGLLEVALHHAAGRRVTDLHIVVGQLSSIVDDSVQFYWDFASANTVCEGAQLHFTRVPTTLVCQDCGHTYTLKTHLEDCPQCHSLHVRIMSGEEFRLDSIEVETEAPVPQPEASLL